MIQEPKETPYDNRPDLYPTFNLPSTSSSTPLPTVSAPVTQSVPTTSAQASPVSSAVTPTQASQSTNKEGVSPVPGVIMTESQSARWRILTSPPPPPNILRSLL